MLRSLLLAFIFILFANCYLSSSASAQGYGSYPPGYPFGQDGNASHPDGYDGFPGDTPPGTPGAPAETPPNGGKGGHGFGSGKGGKGGDGHKGGNGGKGGDGGSDGGAGGSGGNSGPTGGRGGDGGWGGDGKPGVAGGAGGRGGDGFNGGGRGGHGGNGGKNPTGQGGDGGVGGDGGNGLGNGNGGRSGDGGDGADGTNGWGPGDGGDSGSGGAGAGNGNGGDSGFGGNGGKGTGNGTGGRGGSGRDGGPGAGVGKGGKGGHGGVGGDSTEPGGKGGIGGNGGDGGNGKTPGPKGEKGAGGKGSTPGNKGPDGFDGVGGISYVGPPYVPPVSSGAPNALGMWNSSAPLNNGFGIINVPEGQTGNSAWAVLPQSVVSYFQRLPASQRELQFRGVEFRMFRNGNSGILPAEIPEIRIVGAMQDSAPNEGQYVPNFNGPVYASFPAQPWTSGAPSGLVAFRYVLPAYTAVPAGSPGDEGLAIVFVDYEKTGATLTDKVVIAASVNNTGGRSLSGVTLASGATGHLADNLEFAVNFLFDNSLIQPIKNAQLAAPGSPMPGGGVYPAGVYSMICEDGRGALYPQAGDRISYLANSNASITDPNASTNVWLVPFTLFSGDVGLGNDPTPENWVGDAGAAQDAYIHPMPLQKWLDDVGILFGVGPGLGAQLNPNNSTLGLWLGTDLPQLVNFQVFLDAFQFADISSGPLFAGPEVQMYDSSLSPAGQLGRNLVNFGSKVAENKHPLAPQTGYMPITVDFGVLPPQLAGQGYSFSITCWVLDLNSPATGGFNILDTTNVIHIRL